MLHRIPGIRAGGLPILLVLQIMGALQLSAQTDPGQILSKAVQLHQSGAYAEASRQYELFLEMYPDVADVRSNLGATYVAQGRLDMAIEEYRKAIELGNAKDPSAIHFNLGLAYYKTVRLDLAKEQFRKVLEADSENYRAATVLADCHLRMDEYRQVIDLLGPFEKNRPEDKGVAYLLGTALIRSGDIEKGQVLVDKILREGDSAEAHMMLGSAYMMVRDAPRALEEFEKALALNPHLPSANAFVALTLREMGRGDDAVPYFRRELEIDPYHFDSHLHVGVYLANREQKYGEALRHFEQALRIRPGALNVRFQIGLVYVLTERIDEALEIIEEVIREAPDFLEGHVTLTRLYYRLKRTEEARKHREIVERLRAEKEADTYKGTESQPPDGG